MNHFATHGFCDYTGSSHLKFVIWQIRILFSSGKTLTILHCDSRK